MALGDLSDPKAVRNAISECDEMGRAEFLSYYGFKPARKYFIRTSEGDYDSKAIAAVAHRHQFPTLGALTAAEFSGGETTVATKLRLLGFDVVSTGPEKRRNPDWAFDELILALDLYLTKGALDQNTPEVEELSELLNRLPIFAIQPDPETFRNRSCVALKLDNFDAINPDHHGGMSHFGKQDAEMWEEFHDKPERVHQLALAIRSGDPGSGTNFDSSATKDVFPDIPEEGEDEAAEGRLLFRRHRARERNPKLIKRKKDAALKKGPLACEVCGFDFNAIYGPLGFGYIECHHLRPLSASGETTTRLSDLALLCANCHRMAHRGTPWPTISDLSLLVSTSP